MGCSFLLLLCVSRTFINITDESAAQELMVQSGRPFTLRLLNFTDLSGVMFSRGAMSVNAWRLQPHAGIKFMCLRPLNGAATTGSGLHWPYLRHKKRDGGIQRGATQTEGLSASDGCRGVVAEKGEGGMLLSCYYGIRTTTRPWLIVCVDFFCWMSVAYSPNIWTCPLSQLIGCSWLGGVFPLFYRRWFEEGPPQWSPSVVPVLRYHRCHVGDMKLNRSSSPFHRFHLTAEQQPVNRNSS